MSAELHSLPLEPDASGVHEALQVACNLAEQGRISMIAITVVERDGCPHFIRSEVHNRGALIGALARQQFRLMQQADENS